MVMTPVLQISQYGGAFPANRSQLAVVAQFQPGQAPTSSREARFGNPPLRGGKDAAGGAYPIKCPAQPGRLRESLGAVFKRSRYWLAAATGSGCAKRAIPCLSSGKRKPDLSRIPHGRHARTNTGAGGEPPLESFARGR